MRSLASSASSPLLAAALTALVAFASGCGDEAAETAAGAGGGGGAGGSGGGGEPTVPELPAGWTEMPTGGETICSRGTEYAFFVRPGTVNKVIIDFIGGGACWNATTCGLANAIFEPDIDSVREAVEANVPAGFYDHERAENPFKDWYHVVIPYCTGDIHWGDATTTYGEGTSEVTIHHKGAVNSRAVLDWVYESFSAPEQILVTGCSAGSYGSALWAGHVMNHYPTSRVLQFGDSGAGIITDAFFQESFPSWNAGQAFPSFIPDLDPAKNDVMDKQLPDLYVGIADHFPTQQLTQYNTAFDENQAFYFEAMGGSGPEEWSEKMLASIEEIGTRNAKFRSFTASGEQHCILPFDNFYTVNVGGRLLTDWLGELTGEVAPVSEKCTECATPTP